MVGTACRHYWNLPSVWSQRFTCALWTCKSARICDMTRPLFQCYRLSRDIYRLLDQLWIDMVTTLIVTEGMASGAILVAEYMRHNKSVFCQTTAWAGCLAFLWLEAPARFWLRAKYPDISAECKCPSFWTTMHVHGRSFFSGLLKFCANPFSIDGKEILSVADSITLLNPIFLTKTEIFHVTESFFFGAPAIDRTCQLFWCASLFRFSLWNESDTGDFSRPEAGIELTARCLDAMRLQQ